MLQTEIESLLSATLIKLNLNNEYVSLTQTSDAKHGDYTSSVALKLANHLQTTPMELAQKIADAFPSSELVDRVEVLKPGFINIHLSPSLLLKQLQRFSDKNFDLSSFFPKSNKVVIVEYSSPNIAKPFTIGHLRSTIIGDAIANMLQVTGYDVKRDNHVGDWGTQFGKLMYAIEQWGSIEELEKSPRPVKTLVELYVKFHEEADKYPELENFAREKFKLLEGGNKKMRNLWQKCIDWSWKEFDEIYRKLDIPSQGEFENSGRGYAESFFEDKMSSVIDTLWSKKILTESEGAQIIKFPNEKYPPLLIVKNDGSSLYATRDLATDKFRIESYGKKIIIINEVGAEQSLYFKQLYEAEQMLGWFDKRQRIHIKHGLYRFKDKKMSTRQGNTIWLEDVIEEAEKRALSLDKRQTSIQDNEALTISMKQSEAALKHGIGYAERINNMSQIAIASLKWNDLKHSPQQDVIFDWDQILNMEGNSGPYMLYTVVRANSVLAKAGETGTQNGGDATLSGEDRDLVRFISKFPEVVVQATNQYLPSTLATYLFQLAQQYNVFYQTSPILKADENTKALRILITAATAQVLKAGLKLLGIQTVEKM